MKHYKNTKNEVYAYEADGSQDHIIPADFVPITEQEANELRFKPLTPEETKAAVTALIQNILDKAVQEKGYDNIQTACSYALSENKTYAAEGKTCVRWRDTVWAASYACLDKILAENKPVPTEVELLAVLPELKWPEKKAGLFGKLFG